MTSSLSDRLSSRLAVGLLLAAFALPAACGSPFSSCEETLTCQDGGHAGSSGGGGDASDAGGQGGAPSPCAKSCTGATPLCDVASGQCVACLESSDCKKGVCDPEAHACVGCLDHSDCKSATAPLCSDTKCVGCTGAGDCSALDLAVCLPDGSCVACTVDDETACAGNSCNPKTNTCTTTPVLSRTTCQTCVADSECSDADNRCVLMQFQGADHGSYCLKAGSAGCGAPFSTPTPARPSLSGAAAEAYCGVNEAVTTCEALDDLEQDVGCASDDECGAPDLGDGLCKTVNLSANKCTYACTIASQCPGIACGGPSGAKYCGG